MNRGMLVLLLLCLQGCAGMDWPQVRDGLSISPGPLAVAATLSSEDTGLEEKNAYVRMVHERFRENRTARNRLAIAVSYAMPGHELSSDSIARDVLSSVDLQALDPHSRRVAQWLSAELDYRRDLEQQLGALSERADALSERADVLSERAQQLQDELDEAKEQIRVLTRIEESVGPRTPPPQSDEPLVQEGDAP